MNSSVKNHTLYLCYFGMREPLVQTQVLPYLREIARDDIKVSLLTFEPDFAEKWSAEKVSEAKRELAEQQISWFCLPYHKSPSVPATIYDVVAGARFARKMIRDASVNVLHARSHVAAMMGAIAKRTASKTNLKLLFDIRGFMPEEYTDGGNWKPNGRLYKSVKRVEQTLLREADAFVVLTERAREILFPESRQNSFDKRGRPVEVIPCCVDLKRFEQVQANQEVRRQMRARLNVESRFVIVYSGSFGTWYMANEMIDFLVAARNQNPTTFALILTQSPPAAVVAQLKEKGFGENDFLVTRVAPAEIGKYLSAADAAISFIRACYSKQASSPTKIAEYLASGLPVICNRGVGDVDKTIEIDGVGVILDDFDQNGYLKALQQLEVLRSDKTFADRCRHSAKENFDLTTVGGAKYRSLYRRLLNTER